jgi:O-antigen/teichoic acid export membrane protein
VKRPQPSRLSLGNRPLRAASLRATAWSILESSIVRNGLYGWAGLGISTAVILALTPVLIRQLGYEEFGIWTLAISIVGLAGFVEMGVGTASARLLAQHHAASEWKALSEVATVGMLFALTLGLLIGGLLYLESYRVAAIFSGTIHSTSQDQMVSVIRIASIGLAGTLFRGGALAVPMAFQRYDIVAGLGALQSSLVWVAAALVSRLGGDVGAITMSSIFVIWLCVFLAVVIGLRMLRGAGFKPSLSLRRARSLLSYAAVTSITGIGSQLFSSFDKIVVGALLGVSALAYYAILTNVAARLNQLAGLLWQALMPLASVLDSQRADIKLRRYFMRATVAAAIINAGFAVALILVADPLLTLWLGTSFAEAARWPLRILIAIYAAFSISAPGYHIANGIGAAWICAVSGLAGGSLTILLIAVLAPRYGLVGAAVGNAGYLATLLIIVVVYRRLRPKRLLDEPAGAELDARG